MTAEDRITELEVRLSHQEVEISALDEVVQQFARRTERLEARLDQLAQASQSDPSGRSDEPPPHY